MANVPYISPDRVPDDWRIERLGTVAGMAAIWWHTGAGPRMTHGWLSCYLKQWRELLLREGKTPEEAAAIITGPVRLKKWAKQGL